MPRSSAASSGRSKKSKPKGSGQNDQVDLERSYHNRLDFEERAQASSYLTELHSSLDDQLESAAKRALLNTNMTIEGEPMTLNAESLTGASILSARGDIVNPVRSTGDSSLTDPERIGRLVRALRSKAQSLADGGTRFHEVFDSLDAFSTGEISGPSTLLSGLHSLGLKQATKEDAAALLLEFEGSEKGKMSYPKFLKAVMLGNGGKERIAEIIGNLQWSISSAEAEMTDDSPYSPTQLLATLMSENDDDGSGTISRSAFREALDRAFSTLNLQPIEENDIRRLMDHFDRNGRPSYVDFVKVLKSEAGSPKKYGNKGQGSGAPLYSRLQNAMMERRLDSLMVKEMFLPSDVMDAGETTISFKEVETVFTVDLDVSIESPDEREIMSNFGVGRDGVDVKAMLTAWHMWEETGSPNPPPARNSARESARSNPNSSHGNPASRSPRLDETGQSHLQAWSTTMPKKPDESPSQVPRLNLQQQREQLSARDPDPQPSSRSYTSYTKIPSSRKDPTYGGMGGASSPPLSSPANPANSGNLYHPPKPSASISPPRDPNHNNARPMDDELVYKLKAENSKLKAELSSFDLNFFEEIEDLRHNYERLKTVALAQATAGQPGSNPGSPMQVPNQYAGTTSDEMMHDADPFDQAPQKQMAEMMDRANRLAGGIGVPLSPRQNAMFNKKKKKKSKAKYGNEYDYWNSRGGVVGAHERKLAWQIAGGGYEALKEAEKWIRRMDRNGDGYLSGKQVAAALREAGYDLTDSDVHSILNGFGSDELGRVDTIELIQALQDIASGNEWYHQDYVIPTASDGDDGVRNSVGKSGEFMFGTAFNGLQTGYEGKWDGFDAQRGDNLVEAALKEIVEQMSLIDISRLPGYGGGNRASAIMRPFKMCDKGGKGVISITDFSSCIEALGLVLTAGEVRALAHQFSVAQSPSKNSSTHSGTAIEYPPFVRFVLEASTMSRWTGQGGEDWGGPGGSGGAGAWWEVVPRIAVKCKKPYKKSKKKSKWLKSLKNKLKKKGEDLSHASFKKILGGAKIKLGKKDWEDLETVLGGEDDIDWKAFCKVFKAKVTKPADEKDSDSDKSDDDSDDDSDGKDSSDDDDDDDDDDASKSSKDSSDDDSGSDDEDKNTLLAKFAKVMMQQSDPRGWLDSVCYLFSEADAEGNGYMSSSDFYSLCKRVGVKLSKSEFKNLTKPLDKDSEGGMSYIEILSALLKAYKSGGSGGGRAFLGDEREIAEKILDAMGENPGTRRKWLTKLRKHFFGLDKFRNGTMPGPKLVRVLRELGVRLSRSEEGRLLELLPTVDEEDGGDHGDASGSVSYRELLRFCASNAGKWYEQDVDLAETLRNALRDKMRKKSFVANLKKMFEEFDENGDGVVSKKEFEKSCKKLGLRLESSDLKKLMDILDLDGSGQISYQEFVAFFNNSSSKGSWYDDEPELARKIKNAVLKVRDGEKGVFRFRDDSAEADEDQNGHNDVGDFRKNVLRSLKVKFSEREVSKLALVLDSRGDGLINYRPVVSYMVGCLPPLSERLPDEFRSVQSLVQKAKGGKRGVIGSLEERCKVADKDGNGTLGIKSFASVLSRCNIKVSLTTLTALAEAIDSTGEGSMDYVEFLDQLKGSQSYGRDEWYERESRLRKAIWKENSGKKSNKWQKNLRSSFAKFDRDGDGVVSERDFSRAVKGLGVKVSGSEIDRLMEILDQSGDGQISYEDFVEFMVSSDTDRDDVSDNDDDSYYSRGGRGRSKDRKSDYSAVVGDYDDRLSPRGDSRDRDDDKDRRGKSKSRSRSPNKRGGDRGGGARGGSTSKTRGGANSRSKERAGATSSSATRRGGGDEKTKELMNLRKKVLAKLDKGREGMKKLVGAFMSVDQRDEGRVSERDFTSTLKKVGVGFLQRADLKLLFGRFEDDEGLFAWEEFVHFCFSPEKSVGSKSRGRDDLSEDDEEESRFAEEAVVVGHGGRGGGGRPQS
ncbi:hypothetical protein TrLO_g1871, partial [Triparma laevis f. longispina]